jgi:hypothetical protein
VVALFFAMEQREVALGEGGQAVGAGTDGGGREFGIGEKAWASGCSRMVIAASTKIPPFTIAAAIAAG